MCTVRFPFIFRSIVLKNVRKPSFVITLNNTTSIFLQNRGLAFVSCDNMATDKQKLFNGKLDRFQGITVLSTKEECLDSEFQQKLEDSLKYWKTNGNRGIWFNVHLKQASWVPILAEKGFKFHHAKDEYVMMYLWLPETENCNIPHYAHTMIGVGAVVVNDKNQVLVVQEKYKIVDRPFWKLPGGYVEPGENFVDAAIREVQEETNISTKFESVITIGHAHGGMFGCSDIYTIISLHPLNEDIVKCQREIDECKWMNLDEYLDHPDIHELNKFYLQKYFEYKSYGIKINCFHGVHQILNRPYNVYSVTNDKQEEFLSSKKSES